MTPPLATLAGSRALWNRAGLDLRSDESLVQVLDRGSLQDHRALYALARSDGALRRRIVDAVARVPMYLPHFWLVAMQGLGEDVDLARVARGDGMSE
jgi:hypothetical protein